MHIQHTYLPRTVSKSNISNILTVNIELWNLSLLVSTIIHTLLQLLMMLSSACINI